MLERALDEAGATWKDLGVIAVTQGPGLVGSLLVGISAAKSIALSLGLPLVPVHHLAGHIESLVLHNGELPLPSVVLVVPGGHTSLYYVPREAIITSSGGRATMRRARRSDKVAKLLGLGYPGGPIVDKLGEEGQRSRDRFPDGEALASRSQRRPRKGSSPRASRTRSATAPTSASAA